MGHTTVSFSKQGQLSYTEIKKAFYEKVSDDREELGYNGSPDSFYGASSPDKRFLGPIYSPSKAREIIENTRDYNSHCLYTVSREIFMEMHKKEYAKINKLNEKIKLLNEQINQASTEVLTKLGLKNAQSEVKKPIFFTTPCCQSKINVHAFSKYEYHTPERCPICRDSQNNQFGNIWRDKVLGKAYSKIKEKLTAKIEKLKLEIKEIDNSMPESIDISQLNKKQRESIKTVVFADVHF